MPDVQRLSHLVASLLSTRLPPRASHPILQNYFKIITLRLIYLRFNFVFCSALSLRFSRKLVCPLSILVGTMRTARAGQASCLVQYFICHVNAVLGTEKQILVFDKMRRTIELPDCRCTFAVDFCMRTLHIIRFFSTRRA